MKTHTIYIQTHPADDVIEYHCGSDMTEDVVIEKAKAVFFEYHENRHDFFRNSFYLQVTVLPDQCVAGPIYHIAIVRGDVVEIYGDNT